MNHGTLVSHVDTDIVTRAQLLAVPTPESTATFRPVPHYELINMLDTVLAQQSIHIREERFALRRDGAILFGVLHLAYGETDDGIAALGLRTGNNKTMSLQLCAGLNVFACDNLAFRGDMIALKRKHTSGLNLKEELTLAVIRFQEHFGRLTREVASLKTQTLADIEAKALIHDVFARGVMPLRFLPDVSHAYFDPIEPAFEPRNAWSLHNAFTGVAKVMPLSTRFAVIQEVGKLFGMSAETPNVTRLLLPAPKPDPEQEPDAA
jgi:hypothetical protein